MNPGTLFILGLFAFVAYSINKAGDKLNEFKLNLQNAAADTLLGDLIGIRTVAGDAAATWIKKCLWLRKDYREWLLSPQFQYLAKYDLKIMGAVNAADIAEQIIDANYKIFDNKTLERIAEFGLTVTGNNPDNPGQVLNAISRVKNQIQMLEVVHYYYARTEKNLSAGLQWLPDPQMIDLYGYLKALPTGAYLKGTNRQLNNLPTPKNVNL